MCENDFGFDTNSHNIHPFQILIVYKSYLTNNLIVEFVINMY